MLPNPTLAGEPVRLSSYCLGDVEVKMFRIDDLTHVVTWINVKKRQGKSILCLSFEHADYVMEGCIEQLREWVN